MADLYFYDVAIKSRPSRARNEHSLKFIRLLINHVCARTDCAVLTSASAETMTFRFARLRRFDKTACEIKLMLSRSWNAFRIVQTNLTGWRLSEIAEQRQIAAANSHSADICSVVISCVFLWRHP